MGLNGSGFSAVLRSAAGLKQPCYWLWDLGRGAILNLHALKNQWQKSPSCFKAPLLAVWPLFVYLYGKHRGAGAVVVSPAVGQGMTCTEALLPDALLTSASSGSLTLFLAWQKERCRKRVLSLPKCVLRAFLPLSFPKEYHVTIIHIMNGSLHPVF